MLTEIKKFNGNAVSMELTGNFTEADEMFAQKILNEKFDEGYDTVNVLIKLKDLHSLVHADIKAVWQDLTYGLKKFKKFGKVAYVTDSKITQVLIEIEGIKLHLLSPKIEERYFDFSQIDEAMKFIEPEGE